MNQRTAPPRNTRTRRRATVAAVLSAAIVAAAALVTASAPAAAAPGPTASAGRAVPGTPFTPRVLYTEDFETAAGVTALADHESADGIRYTADPYWSSTEACNGFITRYSTPRPSDAYCDDDVQYDLVRAKAYALGLLTPDRVPETNAALSTNSNPPAAPLAFTPDAVEFATTTDVPLPTSTGRFVTFSVDAAATDCDETHPLLRFSLRHGSVERPISDLPIDPCADAQGRVFAPGLSLGTESYDEVHYGSFPADSSVLFDGEPLGVVLRNEATGISGNDGAIDNIRILDVTPQLDVAASPGPTATGGVATLTFTVTNTTDRAAKHGWSFGQQLPAGLHFASQVWTTTCSGTDPSIVGDSFRFTGGIDAGLSSCSASVPVTADRPGTYVIDAASNTTTGLDRPVNASVRFADAGIAIGSTAGQPVDADGDGVIGTGDTVPFTYLVTNTGDTALGAVGVTDRVVEDVRCPADSLAARGSMQCVGDHVLTAEDLAAGSVVSTARATGTPTGGAPITSAPTVATAALPATGAAVGLDGVADHESVTGVDAVVRYRFTTTATGTDPLTALRLDRTATTGTGAFSDPECAATADPLAPGATRECTVDYRTTAGDVRAGSVDLTVVATGTSATTGAVVTSLPVELRVRVAAVPGAVPPTATEPPAGTDPAGTDPAGTDPTTAPVTARDATGPTGGRLATTGVDLGAALAVAMFLLLGGAGVLVARRPTRQRPHRRPGGH